jgi:excisionase family DNA binding protein
MESAHPTSHVPRLGFSPDEAAQSTGVSRTRIFEAIRDGALTARKAGKSTVIEVDELRRWVRSLPTRGRVPEAEGDSEAVAP